ncbi:MAG: HAMP domain-containing histidine kinase [Kiritimatiellales bacterium]|nr:HAMP domain-containing histidine kinase [Kiritimatiellales bacterium]
MKTTPIRIRYFSLLTLLLLASYIIFFGILCLVEFRKAFVDPAEWADAFREVGFFFLVGIASMPLAIALAWRVTRTLLEPLRQMAGTARNISAGAFSERITLNRTYDELDELGTSFNLAFDRYEEAVDKLKNFSADAAHQLRTPLAAIRSTAETVLLNERSPAAYQESLQQILEELHGLSVTVDQLLLLARLESGKVQQEFKPINLAAIAHAATERFQPLTEAKGINLEITVPTSARVSGVEALLDQALANLLDNAIRLTPQNGTIRIGIRLDGKKVTCTVADSGPGIPEQLQSNVFERFRSGSEGSGLGLAIVRDIVHAHQGTVQAGSAPETGGALFTITLPVT